MMQSLAHQHRCAAPVALLCCFAAPAQQSLEWIQEDPLPPVSGLTIAEDTGRGRLVVFGRLSPSDDETWEWDGVSWTRRIPATRPPGRAATAIAYDAARRRVVLFGGSVLYAPSNDTWQWDGTTWTLWPPGQSPAPRLGHGMAYDSARQRIVLFGGQATGGDLNDTWEWDGTRWTNVTPSRSPSRRSYHGLAYDAARQRVVLFGGRNVAADTWTWDGTTWTKMSPARIPTARATSLTYDPQRQRVVMFGGNDSAGVNNETWEWDGATWSQAQPPVSPSARSAHSLSWHTATQRVVLLGGAQDGIPDHWEWDGQQWTQRSLAIDPGYTQLGPTALVYDTVGQRVLSSDRRLGLWAWSGSSWTLIDRSSTMLEYLGPTVWDQARGRIVMFGGYSGNGWKNWTHEWNGTWQRVLPPSSPPAYFCMAMAYDAARRRTVLHSGTSTWEFDGTTWIDASVPVHPTTACGDAMTYDAARQRVVLFGGSSLAETWEWDGTTWIYMSPTSSPAPRGSHVMAYDSLRQRVVLQGGLSSRTTYTDTWEWDGSTWTQVTTTQSPQFLPQSMIYDVSAQRMVLRSADGTWTLGATLMATHQAYGAGCGGQAGIPALDAFGRPGLGNPSFALDMTSARTASPGVFVLAPLPASVQVGPCTLLVDPSLNVALPALTSGYGFASVRLPVPSSIALIGARVYGQASALDPTAPLGLGLTNGLSLLFGE